MCVCVIRRDYVNWHSQDPFGCCTVLHSSILTEQMSGTLQGRKKVFVLVKGVISIDSTAG